MEHVVDELTVDHEPCAREPIHIIGQIQSHGLLFALSEPELVVRHVSANVAGLLGIVPDTVIGRSFETVLGASQFETFRAQLLGDDLQSPNPLRMLLGADALDTNCVAHRYDGVLIVEFEPIRGTDSLGPLSVAAHFRLPVTRMTQANDIPELSRVAASEIRKLSGFDRVMVYRFDEAWNGEVIAEITGSAPLAYIGLRFPASDIPSQARRLFLINPMRAIADATSTPVPIVPDAGPSTERALDLTHAFLRSASPIHLEYLGNMGVRASMTISIVVRGKLWGMIACHHATPHLADVSTRSLCELIGQILSSQVTLLSDNLALEARLTSRRLLEDYMARMETAQARGSKVFADGELIDSAGLLEVMDADGMIWSIDGVISARGATVEEEALRPVVRGLQRIASRGVASSDMLGALDAGAKSYANKAGGALYVGLSDASRDFLLFLRKELIETVRWAGNPTTAVTADPDGSLRPRQSFAAWQETVRGRSRPWTELERENASFLREQLLQLREAQRLHQSEERVRYLAEYDELTGLINRHGIELKLDRCLSEAESGKTSFAVLFIDLDRFKDFNDRLGHAAGDRILHLVAARMRQNVRAVDAVGRLGGDEFIVIMPGLSEQSAALKAAGRLLRAIEAPFGIDSDARYNITASIGISRYPVDGTNRDVLVKRSDMAMYRVKRKGGNDLEVVRAEENATVAKT